MCRDILWPLDAFRNVTWVKVNRGDTVLFSNDLWQHSRIVVPLQHKFGRLLSFARRPYITVEEVLKCDDIIFLFNLPLSDAT